MTPRTFLPFAILACSACGDDPNCWPVSVGTTYEVTVKERLPGPATGMASCGPSFDLDLGTVLRVRPDDTIQLEGKSCQTVARASLVEERTFGSVVLTTEGLTPSGGQNTVFPFMWYATLPSGCTGEWTVIVYGTSQSRFFESYQLGNAAVTLLRVFGSADPACAKFQGCMDIFGVEVKPLP